VCKVYELIKESSRSIVRLNLDADTAQDLTELLTKARSRNLEDIQDLIFQQATGAISDVEAGYRLRCLIEIEDGRLLRNRASETREVGTFERKNLREEG
jgi:hypothetical protein